LTLISLRDILSHRDIEIPEVEDCMTKDKKELLDNFMRLDPENRANVLAHVRVAVAAQETTKKSMGKVALAKDKARKTA
jgi:hypothetical protein